MPSGWRLRVYSYDKLIEFHCEMLPGSQNSIGPFKNQRVVKPDTNDAIVLTIFIADEIQPVVSLDMIPVVLAGGRKGLR